MIKIYPLIFIILWSSAFVTTKPIIDNSDPFAALAFRFFFVALGFFIFAVITKHKISTNSKNLFQSIFSGVLFHGVYLGGVFYSVSIGMPTGIAALIVTLQPILTNALAGKFLGEDGEDPATIDNNASCFKDYKNGSLLCAACAKGYSHSSNGNKCK